MSSLEAGTMSQSSLLAKYVVGLGTRWCWWEEKAIKVWRIPPHNSNLGSKSKENEEQASRWRCLGRRSRTACFLTWACLCISPLRSSKYVLSPPSYSASNSSFNFLFLFRCFFLALSSSSGSFSSLMSSSVSSLLNFQIKKYWEA